MEARLVTVILGCLGCCVFPAIVHVMTLTYEEPRAAYGTPGPFPYSAVDYLFYADLVYTILLIWMMRGWRRLTALIAIPLLVVTAGAVLIAGAWFKGQYL